MKHLTIRNVLIASFSLLAVAGYLKKSVGNLGYTEFDDAYMIVRYAKHWLAGEGFSWNTVDGSAYGITSPLYLIIITAVLGLTNFSDAMVLTMTSWVSGLLSLVVLVILGFIIQDSTSQKKSWLPILVVPCFLFTKTFSYHSLTGMETTLSMLCNSLLACSIVIVIKRRTTATLLLCVFIGFLSYATRPDNGLYALLLPPLFFIVTDRSFWRYAIQYIAFFSILTVCSLIINRLVFGDFLPLPFFAKTKGFYKGYLGATKWNAMAEMLTFCKAALPFLLVIVGTATRKTLWRLAAIAVVITFTFGYYATVTQIMGFHARYYYPSIGFVVLAAYMAIFSATGKAHRLASHVTMELRFFFGLLILLPAFSNPVKNLSINLWRKHAIDSFSAVQSITQYQVTVNDTLPQLGWWNSIERMSDLLKQMPQETVLAASEYGVLGSRFANMTIVDLVGLHDRTVAHNGFSADYVLSKEPDLIWLPHSDYTYAVSEILDHPTFRKNYEYYPGAYDYGIALLKHSKKHIQIKEVVSREFSRIYSDLNISDYIAKPVTPPDKE